MTYQTWIWAAKNGFEELRTLAEEVCEDEIYKKLEKRGELKRCYEKGVPVHVLDGLMSKAAEMVGKYKQLTKEGTVSGHLD